MTTTIEPKRFNAGENLTWSKSLGDYPASTWTLTYTLFNASNAYSFVATADGDAYSIDVQSATTATWAAGKYAWTAFVSDGTEQHTVADGTWVVGDNPSTVSARDGRSHARKMLDAIESALEGQATADQLDILATAIGDRNISRNSAKLIEMRDKYRAEVVAEDRAEAVARGESRPGFIRTRFSGA